MEYYSKSVAPWCPSSCSCTFYHFARVQGPSPPSYTGDIWVRIGENMQNFDFIYLVFRRAVEVFLPPSPKMFKLENALPYSYLSGTAQSKNIHISFSLVLVNCSGQGLTSFPRVRAHSKVKKSWMCFAHNWNILISKDMPLGTTADDSAGPFAKQFGRGIQFN